MTNRPISEIIVGFRHRRELGDIAALADSIRDVGLLHPIVIRPDGVLVAGGRRLAACKSLGWTEIPVTVVDLEQIVHGELAENAHRKDFLPSEIDAIRRALEPAVKAEATSRKLSGRSTDDVGETRDKIGAFAGVSGKTVEKIAAVCEAAAAEPEKYGKLMQAMDATGRIDGPFKRLKVMRQAESIRLEPPALPGKGPYRVIVADPPWPYEVRNDDPSHRATHPYPQQSIADICAMDVAAIAHTDCILWLWTTNHHMCEAFSVLDAWGFEHRTILTWVKHSFGMGDWLRGQTEHCLLAIRGNPTVTLTNQTTVLHAPRGRNSEKPVAFYDFVESLCPAPRYATLYHRGVTRPNWDGHGDEVGRPLGGAA